MKKSINSIINIKYDLRLIDLASLLYSIVIFGLIFFDKFRYGIFADSVLFAVAAILAVLVLKSENAGTQSSAKNNIVLGLISVTAFQIVVTSSGGNLFPLYFLIMPLLYALLGPASAIIALLPLSAVYLTPSPGVYSALTILFLTASTLLFGRLIYGRLNRFRYSLNSSRKKVAEKAVTSSSLNIREADTVKREIKDSLEFAGKLIPANSIVLYIRDNDGLFEIYDFVSATSDAIDKSQKIVFRSGYLSWLIKTKEPIVIDEIKNFKENAAYYNKNVEVKSLLAVPLLNRLDAQDISQRETEGILILDNYEKAAFTDEHKEIATSIADKIHLTLQIEKLQKNVLDSGDELSSIYDYIQKLESNMDIDKIINHLLNTLLSTVSGDLICISLTNHENNTSTLRAVNLENEKLINTTVSNTNSLIGLVNETNKALSFFDITERSKFRTVFDKELDFALNIKKIKSAIIMPITVQQEGDEIENDILGTVFIGRNRKIEFNEEQKNLATVLIQQAAKAITYSTNLSRINELAIKDGLSGLYNHRHFKEMLSNLIARAIRYSEELSLMLMDVDNFKSINDEFGHQRGDSIIHEIGKIISESLREIDIAARYGGDEFAVVLPKTSESGAMVVVEKLTNRINASRALNSEKLKITFSIGIASMPGNAMTLDSLIEKADIALYEAKNKGKDQVVHYNDVEDSESKSENIN